MTKLKMARRMLTKPELVAKVPPFLSAAWLERKRQIAKRVFRQQTIAHYWAEQRRGR